MQKSSWLRPTLYVMFSLGGGQRRTATGENLRRHREVAVHEQARAPACDQDCGGGAVAEDKGCVVVVMSDDDTVFTRSPTLAYFIVLILSFTTLETNKYPILF